MSVAEAVSSIGSLASSAWPVNRERGDYRTLLRELADLEPRRIECARCGARSRLVDGPEGRAWFARHREFCA